jgi:hypothetical protein
MPKSDCSDKCHWLVAVECVWVSIESARVAVARSMGWVNCTPCNSTIPTLTPIPIPNQFHPQPKSYPMCEVEWTLVSLTLACVRLSGRLFHHQCLGHIVFFEIPPVAHVLERRCDDHLALSNQNHSMMLLTFKYNFTTGWRF